MRSENRAHHSAVDTNGGASGCRGRFAAQKDHHGGDLFWCFKAFDQAAGAGILEELTRELHVSPDKKIHTFIYASQEQKGRLIGASGTDFAKPWLSTTRLLSLYSFSERCFGKKGACLRLATI